MRQQLDPLTGRFTREDAPGYSPCALVMVDYTWRLVGVQDEGDQLLWNVRPHHAAAAGASLSRKTDGGRVAAIRYDPAGATLTLGGTTIARVEGGAVRIVTDDTGRLVALRGIEMQDQQVTLTTPGRSPRRVRLPANRDLPA